MNKKKAIYFLGIGGIGMSALARFYNVSGYQVYGYDLTKTPLTEALRNEEITIHYDDKVDFIPEAILANKDSIVVYTTAIPKDNAIFIFLERSAYKLIKRAEALGLLSKEFKTIAIAGTHGKTTTSAIAAHILKRSKLASVAFVGGVMTGYESNFLMDDQPTVLLVEADEFDRSFLQLNPDYLGITSIDADHLDIYSDEKDLEKSFKMLTDLVPHKENITVCNTITSDSFKSFTSYGFIENAAINIRSKGYKSGFHSIEVDGLDAITIDFSVPMPGNYNALNAVLAASLCYQIGVSLEVIKESIASFKGIKRRFEYIINTDDCILIDDYAHHPTEINALLDAVKQLYPERKITGVFQPHLYSRTRDFMDEFASSLSRLDQLYLLDIYPAREKAIPGITSEKLLNLVDINEKSIVNKDNLPVLISSTIPEILLLIGAGDIAHLVPALKQAIINKISE
jgi:UDP-N-acetylmuramate--alanine ligase